MALQHSHGGLASAVFTKTPVNLKLQSAADEEKKSSPRSQPPFFTRPLSPILRPFGYDVFNVRLLQQKETLALSYVFY